MISDSVYRTFLGHRPRHVALPDDRTGTADAPARGAPGGAGRFVPGARADPGPAAPDPAALPGSERASERVRTPGHRPTSSIRVIP